MKKTYIMALTAITTVSFLLVACENPNKDIGSLPTPVENPTPIEMVEEKKMPVEEKKPVLSKKEWFDKLNLIEERDRNEKVDGTKEGMRTSEKARLQRWENEFSAINKQIEKNLDKEKLKKFEIERNAWIDDREDAAQKAKLRVTGTGNEELEYISTQASITKDRCYELVSGFIK